MGIKVALKESLRVRIVVASVPIAITRQLHRADTAQKASRTYWSSGSCCRWGHWRRSRGSNSGCPALVAVRARGVARVNDARMDGPCYLSPMT